MARVIPFAALLSCVSMPLHAASATFCAALDGLRTEAKNKGVPQRVAIIIIKDEEMTFACRQEIDVVVQKAFCDAALEQVGLESTHAFPWSLRDCLSRDGVRPSTERVNQYTGLQDREKLVRMWGQWEEGTRIDVRFEPSGDLGDQPNFRSYFGTYKLVVWQPTDG